MLQLFFLARRLLERPLVSEQNELEASSFSSYFLLAFLFSPFKAVDGVAKANSDLAKVG